MKLRSTLVAVDTNFLLDLAADAAFCHEALEVMRGRLPALSVLLSPTTLDELGHAVSKPDPVGCYARSAARSILRPWRFQPVDLEPVQHGIVERIAENIRARGYLPPAEINDALILAEAALLGCALLLTSDRHLLEAPAGPLKLLLDSHDVASPLIVSPRKLVRDFFPKR